MDSVGLAVVCFEAGYIVGIIVMLIDAWHEKRIAKP
jgi:hypothetical protein